MNVPQREPDNGLRTRCDRATASFVDGYNEGLLGCRSACQAAPGSPQAERSRSWPTLDYAPEDSTTDHLTCRLHLPAGHAQQTLAPPVDPGLGRASRAELRIGFGGELRHIRDGRFDGPG